jgi:5-methyltetrahydropteroyltriglutamate--homocysteine methyltransferase
MIRVDPGARPAPRRGNACTIPQMFATIVGAYPRTSLPGQPFRLRSAHGQLERGELDEGGFRAVQDELVREVLAEQLEAGLTVVTDGQVRWEDQQTAVARGLDGFEITGLLRYFDTNTYYRQPRATGEPRWKGPILVDDWKFADRTARDLARKNGQSDVRVKATLVGPYSLARLSDAGDLDRERFAFALAEALNREIRALAEAGAEIIQLDENALTLIGPGDDGERRFAGEAIRRAVNGVSGVDLTLAVTMGSAQGAGPELIFGLPFSSYLFDLVAGSENWRLLAYAPGDRTIVCGVADARNTRPDDEDVLVSAARYAASLGGRGLDRVGLSPSTGLEYLPRDRARAKIRALGAAARRAAETPLDERSATFEPQAAAAGTAG